MIFRKKNVTKWLPIHAYQFRYDEFMVFTRMNKDTGLFDFKTKQMSKGTRGAISHQVPINANIQFSQLLSGKL